MLDITLDGGGTKLNAILFDEQFRVVRRARASGVNHTQNGREAAAANVTGCLDALLPDGTTEIGDIYAVFVGDEQILRECLCARVRFRHLYMLEEAYAGLLAGAGYRTGLLALSGTGSDMFNIHAGKRGFVGGLGPILGDQGSGAWMGLQAIRAVGRDVNGWGEKTSLTDVILKKYSENDRIFDVVWAFHDSGTPYAMAASLVPLITEAAYAGDAVALEIFRSAGDVLARQMIALLNCDPVWEHDVVTLCGGAWKSHPMMKRAFENTLHTVYPQLTVNRPWFEHVIAGMMEKALSHGYSREKARAILQKNCTEECLDERNRKYECD